jgi:pectin methylesterase-like acyl-CoA thioesterase
MYQIPIVFSFLELLLLMLFFLGKPVGQKIDQNGGNLISWNPATSKANFIVAKDGSGTHTTINDAVAALSRMGHDGSQRIIIYVKSGVYNENVEIERNMKNVMFVGDGMDKTIVTGNRNVPDGSTTFNSATFGKNKKHKLLGTNWLLTI